MSGWVAFWALTLGATLVAYTALTAWVAAGGLADVRALFRSLDAAHHDDDGDHGRSTESHGDTETRRSGVR